MLSPGGRRGVLAVCVTLLLAAGVAGCASNSQSPAVLHVDAVAIDRATVDHWARAIALGSAVEGVTGQSSSTPKQKALEFLISGNWAIGAAAERGLGVSDGAVARGLKEKIEDAPTSGTEFEEEIAATGQTLADVKLEIKVALALAKLREVLSRSVPPVTQAQIADYYKRHLESFRIPERRRVDLVEGIHGYAHAVDLGKRLGPGERFAKRATHELVTRDPKLLRDVGHQDWRAPLLRAIFATPPGRVGGPASFHYEWILLVVRKLVPSSIKPLREVNAEIAARLSDEHHSQALASFLGGYRREWTTKTSCEPGYVVQGCSEYRGRLVPQGNLPAD